MNNKHFCPNKHNIGTKSHYVSNHLDKSQSTAKPYNSPLTKACPSEIWTAVFGLYDITPTHDKKTLDIGTLQARRKDCLVSVKSLL